MTGRSDKMWAVGGVRMSDKDVGRHVADWPTEPSDGRAQSLLDYPHPGELQMPRRDVLYGVQVASASPLSGQTHEAVRACL